MKCKIDKILKLSLKLIKKPKVAMKYLNSKILRKKINK